MLFFQLLILTFISLVSNAQGITLEAVDSLKNKTPIELANLIKSSEAKEIEVYENIFLNLPENEQYNSVTLYFDVANFFYTKVNYEKSLLYFSKTDTLARKLNNYELLCRVYLKMGNIYLKEWRNQKALDTYHVALTILQENKNVESEIIANSGIAIIYRRMGQLEKALKVSTHALRLTKNTSFEHGKNHVNLLTIVSETYLDQKKYDSVIHYTGIGIDLSKSINYKIGLIDLYTKRSSVFFYRDDLDQAFDNLHRAENILLNNPLKTKKYLINLNYFLASCLYKQESYDKAIIYLKKTITSLQKKDSKKITVLYTYRLLADCYIALGDEKESAGWMQKYTLLRDQFLNEKDKTIHKINDRDIQKLGKQIEDLNQEKIDAEEKKKYVLLFLLLILFGLIITIFLYVKKQSTYKKVFNNLVEKIDRLESQEDLNNSNASKQIVINDDKVSKVLKGLARLERQEYFLKPECNLTSIAKKVKTNTTYLTKIIHTHKEKKFNDYMTDLRIDYALHRLKNDKKFRAFSVKSIAAEVGYKSDDAFTKHFRAKTGLNPSYYIKNIKKNYNKNSFN